MRKLLAPLAVLVTLAAVVGAQPIPTAEAPPQYRPPQVQVDPGAQADARQVRRVVAEVAADPRGWRTDLDRLTIRIVRAGTYGTAPDNGQPGVGGMAFIEPDTAAISDRFWNKLGEHTARLGVTLDQQRAWFINHEVGHLLGHDHQECAGSGPAPVMRAVTYKVSGCDWNAWPYAQERAA